MNCPACGAREPLTHNKNTDSWSACCDESFKLMTLGSYNKPEQQTETQCACMCHTTSMNTLLERHKALAGKYGKALQALKEVGDNFENYDADWVKKLVKELNESINSL